jgi:hypothetical protein
MTPSGIEPATFRLAKQCLNQLRVLKIGMCPQIILPPPTVVYCFTSVLLHKCTASQVYCFTSVLLHNTLLNFIPRFTSSHFPHRLTSDEMRSPLCDEGNSQVAQVAEQKLLKCCLIFHLHWATVSDYRQQMAQNEMEGISYFRKPHKLLVFNKLSLQYQRPQGFKIHD